MGEKRPFVLFEVKRVFHIRASEVNLTAGECTGYELSKDSSKNKKVSIIQQELLVNNPNFDRQF